MTERVLLLLLAGTLLVSIGCTLFVDHVNWPIGLGLMATGVIAEFAAVFLLIRHVWSRKNG